MKTIEKLESIGCRKDEKARRVSNTAPDRIANITAEEIERGVTLERLETIGVPVYAYSGQVTIHGKLPAFNERAMAGGYKSLVKNQNGSVGVRYVAIDAEKKKTIVAACRYAKNGWFASINSQGLTLSRPFTVLKEEDRQAQKSACLEMLRSLPCQMFYGSAAAFTLPFGVGYEVEVAIGAVPSGELWNLIKAIFGMNKEQYEEKMDHEQKEAEERREAMEKRKKEDAEKMEALQRRADVAMAQVQGERMPSIPRGACAFRVAIGFNDSGELVFRSYAIVRRGPVLCIQAPGGFRKVDATLFDKWDTAAKRGWVLKN